MNSPFLRYLNQAARGAKSTTEKGRVLEVATKRFLTGDVVQQQRFDRVWLWDEYDDDIDTGVDLVAIERKTGKRKTGRRIAIQCKFYSSRNVGWKDISTFVATCSTNEFAAGILVITTDLTKNARQKLRKIPTIEVWRPEKFDNSNIEWDNWDHQHRPEPSIEELLNEIRGGRHRPKPHIEDLLVQPRHIPPRPRPYPSQPDYGRRRIGRYSADRSPDKDPSVFVSNLKYIAVGILCMIAAVAVIMLFTRVDEVVQQAIVGVPAAISMLLTRAEAALRIIFAIVIVLGIFAFYGAFQRR